MLSCEVVSIPPLYQGQRSYQILGHTTGYTNRHFCNRLSWVEVETSNKVKNTTANRKDILLGVDPYITPKICKWICHVMQVLVSEIIVLSFA